LVPAVSWKGPRVSGGWWTPLIPDSCGSAPVFLAQFREKPELKAEYAKAAARWTEHGRTVTEHHVLTEEAWMLFVYGFRAEEDRAHSQERIDATVPWFEGLS
jgi:hypothetical protein